MDNWSIIAAALAALLSVFVGGAITWGVSKRASDHLMEKADQLQGTVNALARYLSDAGIADVKFNEQGNVTYFRYGKSVMQSTSMLTATGTVAHRREEESECER